MDPHKEDHKKSKFLGKSWQLAAANSLEQVLGQHSGHSKETFRSLWFCTFLSF